MKFAVLRISLPKMVLAAAVQGAIFRATRKLGDHQSWSAFAGAFGTCPGEKRPDAQQRLLTRAQHTFTRPYCKRRKTTLLSARLPGLTA